MLLDDRDLSGRASSSRMPTSWAFRSVSPWAPGTSEEDKVEMKVRTRSRERAASRCPDAPKIVDRQKCKELHGSLK